MVVVKGNLKKNGAGFRGSETGGIVHRYTLVYKGFG